MASIGTLRWHEWDLLVFLKQTPSLLGTIGTLKVKKLIIKHYFFFRSIAEKEGVWGVSVTAIPTATRPGHVALTGGFYEDPSTLGKGKYDMPINWFGKCIGQQLNFTKQS